MYAMPCQEMAETRRRLGASRLFGGWEMNQGTQIIGRLLDGAGREIGAIATFAPVDAVREALEGNRIEPIFAAVIPLVEQPTKNVEAEDEKPGHL